MQVRLVLPEKLEKELKISSRSRRYQNRGITAKSGAIMETKGGGKGSGAMSSETEIPSGGVLD